MCPDVFNRIQLRCVGWQSQGMDSSFQARQEIGHHSTAVRRQAVPDNEQLAGYDTEQLLQEDHYLRTPHAIGKHFEVQLPPAPGAVVTPCRSRLASALE